MKNFLQVILTLPPLLLLASLSAQVAPSIEWQKCFGGSDNDDAYSIQLTNDGGFIIAGDSYSHNGDVSLNHGNSDYWITRIDENGNLLWQKSFGGSSVDYAESILQTADGGFIVAGSSSSIDGDVTGNHGTNDYWIVKLDTAGNLQWQKCFGGTGQDVATCIRQTSDGGFVVAGFALSNDGDVTNHHGNSESSDYWILKLDSVGNLEWQKSLGGSLADQAFSIQQTHDGGFIVAGTTLSNDGDVTGNHGNYDYWIDKLDSIGNLLWQTSLGGSSFDEATSVQLATSGEILVAGYSDSNDGDVSGNHGGYDYLIFKLNSDGSLVWSKPYGGYGYDGATSILQTSDEGFMIAGWSNSNDGDVSGNHGDYDYWIIKIDTNGNLIWQKSFGGSDDDEAFGITAIDDDEIAVSGYSYSNDGDVSGNHSDFYGYPSDFWIIKLSSAVVNSIIASSKQISSLFPNPVQSQLNINLATPANEVTVRVYNVQGKMMVLPTSNFQSQTSNSLQLNTENLPSGFYTLQILNNKTGESQVGKFVKTD